MASIQCKKMLPHPLQGPDLYSIQHMQALMEIKLRERQVKNKKELEIALQDIWENIPLNITQNLVHYMKRNFKAVLYAKAGPTKYLFSYY